MKKKLSPPTCNTLYLLPPFSLSLDKIRETHDCRPIHPPRHRPLLANLPEEVLLSRLENVAVAAALRTPSLLCGSAVAAVSRRCCSSPESAAAVTTALLPRRPALASHCGRHSRRSVVAPPTPLEPSEERRHYCQRRVHPSIPPPVAPIYPETDPTPPTLTRLSPQVKFSDLIPVLQSFKTYLVGGGVYLQQSETEMGRKKQRVQSV
ncbi:uncharacterized protein LOC121765351 isoform X2 [Salvia splendens]|uniref:uncharacterized protein LOC121765351 isoform X2 n=1 Tax=Salvia splendens TaxID=180675 RepID=UPI001C268DA8|nr:uncharacterized protein LOC121765351 isoform X2 [Salvia splendens]